MKYAVARPERASIDRAVKLGLACALLAFAGCGKTHDAAKERDTEPLAVERFRVGDGGAGDALVLSGRVEAAEEVTVRAGMAGRVTAIPYREGAAFLSGDALVRLDAPEARDRIVAARAGVDAARARRDLARLQEARIDSLHVDRVASQHEFELAQTERRAADAAFADAEAALTALIEGAAPSVAFAGVVVRLHADVGSFVRAGDAIADVRSMRVGTIVVSVPEGHAGHVRGKTWYQIGEGPWREARLARLDGMVDPGTRTLDARFRPVGGPEGLAPGAFARVRIERDRGVARGEAPGEGRAAAEPLPITIPSRAVFRRGGLSGVYVLRDERAWLRWVRLGRTMGDEVEVLSGLRPGEEIALDPSGLSDGHSVRAGS